MSNLFDPATLRAARTKDAFAYWDGKRAGRAMPARRDIDPAGIPKLLPYLMLIDVLPEPLDFRYRLIGTEVCAISRADFTGQRFSAVPGKGRGSTVFDNCEQVVHSKAPFSRRPPYIGPEQYLRDCENVLLPLSDDGASVNMILQVISFERGLP